MQILDKIETDEPLFTNACLPPWRRGRGWWWFQSHESLHGPTQHFVVFYRFWPKSQTWSRSTLTTIATTTFHGNLGVR